MEVADKLKLLGLSDQKVKETMKNESLTVILADIVDQAQGKGELNKSVGNLLYSLGTKLPRQFHTRLPLLVEYVARAQINQEAKLTAAIKFVRDHALKDFNTAEFEKACGVGVEVSQCKIEEAVTQVIRKHTEVILKQRYQYKIGPLMGQVRAILQWADCYKVKQEIDKQILILLGPKKEQDLKPVKGKPEKKKNMTEVQHTETQSMNMEEFLKTVHFHATGQNHMTEGYVITENTNSILKEHLKITGGQVRTRFPPEPNGILHIGHAKAININFGYAAANNGICFLRYDDTNPEKEEEKFFVGIKNMVEWLVRGHNQSTSPWRERPIHESLQLFEDMKNGKFDEGEATLRLKTTLEEGKLDPVAYRVKFIAHHRTGDTWCIYPTYDYTHCLCDSIEQITHSLCTKEFQSRRSSYYWLCNALDIYCPVQWEYGRLNMHYTVVSKRKIAKLISGKHVRDWDDPRLFTLSALRRRGFPPEAINSFCATLGLTGAQIVIHPDALEACVRNVLNVTSHRAMAVLNPLRVIITNYPNKSPTSVTVPNIPGNDSAGTHTVIFDEEVWIESSDFQEVEEKGYRRLTPSQSVGLRHCGYILQVQEVIRNTLGGIDHLKVICQKLTDSNKPKTFIQWVSKPLKCEVRLYERLFNHESPEDASVVPGGFLTDVNPNSLNVLSALVDVSVKGAQVLQNFQFERSGYYSVDPDSTPHNLVFNRTVGLKKDKGKKSNGQSNSHGIYFL
ncbi:hypothetical protein Pmani_024160 [Petrolisthes manimaculis]|uniref:Probable glutamine--tRNA ligase n=1 Tax=Petrolisthes manimaculis TaxID=1843537 RepID=A0AAE1U2J4_9EUCA|nr:hypothetical protein Pmani_024160 [Petrolisthes manimaculis]